MSVKLLSPLFCELGIFSFALTGGTLAPCVQATFPDTKHSAHDDKGEFLLGLSAIDLPLVWAGCTACSLHARVSPFWTFAMLIPFPIC